MADYERMSRDELIAAARDLEAELSRTLAQAAGRVFATPTLDLGHDSLARFDQCPLPMYLFDQETLQFCKVNEATRRLYGYTDAEFMKMKLPELWHEQQDAEAALHQIRNYPASFFYYRGLRRHRTKSGELLQVEVMGQDILFNGRKSRVGLILDVTERRRAEEALRESEERYRELVELSPDAIFIETDRTITFVNSACVKLLGASSPADLLGRRAADFIHPDDREQIVERRRRMLQEERSLAPAPHKKLRLDGTAVDVEVKAAPFTYQGRKGSLVVARDITERRRAEAALRESEERYRLLVEVSPDGVFIESEGRIIFANNACARLLGASSPAELIGKRVLDLTHPDFREQIRDRIRQMRAGNTMPPYAHKKIRLDGTLVDVEVAAAPFTYAGRPVGQAVMRDITERKRAEEELAKTNAELEKFVLVASHDLQEPLRTTANAALLLDQGHGDKLGGEAKELLGFIVSGVTHMRRLIDGLLVFSGIGEKPAVPAATDSGALVADVLGNLRAVIQESGAVIDCGPLPVVRADPSQLEQVFMNLVGNAIKFRGAAAPRIRIEAQREGSQWLFSVADNGIGINPAYFEKVFELFERLHGGGRYPGTGLGLAICKKIVEHNNGRIWVESEEDKGSKFFFTVDAA